MELHQPLLPLNAKPPTSAPNSEQPISAAVASPLEFSSGLRDATSRMKTVMPATGAYSLYQVGAVRPRARPRARGVWLLAASGHRFRHSPGAVSQSSGSDGIAKLHHSRNPMLGFATSATHNAPVAATVSVRPTRHAHAGARRRISM